MKEKIYELFYIWPSWRVVCDWNIDYLTFQELEFRYNGINKVYVKRFWKYVLVICFDDYGFAWVNKAS